LKTVKQLADILEPVYARNSKKAHLTLSDRNVNTQSARTLCGEPVLARARSVTFLAVGCLVCAELARDAGIELVRDGNTVVGLSRFIQQRRAHAH